MHDCEIQAWKNSSYGKKIYGVTYKKWVIVSSQESWVLITLSQSMVIILCCLNKKKVYRGTATPKIWFKPRWREWKKLNSLTQVRHCFFFTFWHLFLFKDFKFSCPHIQEYLRIGHRYNILYKLGSSDIY